MNEANQVSDRAFDATLSLIEENRANKPTLLDILRYCDGVAPLLRDMEAELGPEAQEAGATQPIPILVEWLVQSGALEAHDVDESGAEIDEARREGLTSDEIDDLVFDTAYCATETGMKAIQHFDPNRATQEVIAEDPQLSNAYQGLIEFLSTRRSLGEISRYLDDAWNIGLHEGEGIAASTLVDRLKNAGRIKWDDGWIAIRG